MSRPPEWDDADKHFGLGDVVKIKEPPPAPVVHAHVSRREPLTETVTCCDDCPFSVARLPIYGNAAAFWCNHGALGPEIAAKKSPGGHAPPPEWCPLRLGPTLVQLKVAR